MTEELLPDTSVDEVAEVERVPDDAGDGGALRLDPDRPLAAVDAGAAAAGDRLDFGGSLFRLADPTWAGYLNEPGGYYRWLAGCVATLQPRLILELGTYTGAGTISLMAALPADSRLITVDIRRDHRFIPPEALADPRLRVVVGDDLDLGIFGAELPAPIDLLFVDTVHRRWQVEREWAVYRHLLAPDALVVFDDIRLNDLGAFWADLAGEKLDLTHRHASGFGVHRHRGPAPDPAAARAASATVVAERSGRRFVDLRDRLVAEAAAWKSRIASGVHRPR